MRKKGGEKYRVVYSSQTGINELDDNGLELEDRHEVMKDFRSTVKSIKKTLIRKGLGLGMGIQDERKKKKEERIKIGERIIDFLFPNNVKSFLDVRKHIFPSDNTKYSYNLIRNIISELKVATRGVILSSRKGTWGISHKYDQTKGVEPIKEAWRLNYGEKWKNYNRKSTESTPSEKETTKKNIINKKFDIPSGQPVRITVKMFEGEINISPSHDINIRAKNIDGIIEVL